MTNIDATQVIVRYKQALADATDRAILAEAALATTLGELADLRAAQSATAPEEEA